MTAYLLATSMLGERVEGTWQRCIVAGARPSLFLWSHLIEGVILLMITFVIYAGYSLLFLVPGLKLDSAILLSLLILGCGAVGLLFGLMFSTIMDTVKSSMMITLFSAYPATFISGECEVIRIIKFA